MKKILLSIITLSCTHLLLAKDIYVAKNGNDANSGTLTSPYLTLSKAAAVAVAGDTVYIREGTYEETLTPSRSGSAGNPIVFTSYQNESVVISAMQTVNGFTLDSGNIYKTTLDWDLGQRMFVMNNNTVLDLARWPNNIDGDRFTLNSLRSEGGSDRNSPKSGHLLNSKIPNLPWENGGSLTFYGDRPGSGWLTWRFPISGSSNGRVNWTSTFPSNFDWIVSFHPPKDGGDFFLEGIKEALDYQNEWYFNPTTKELFLQLPNGSAPVDGAIQVARRENTININRKNYIEIRNLAVYGGSIRMNGSNNKLFQVSSFYGAMTRGSSARNFATDIAAVYVGFGNLSNNIIEKCEIAYGDASGIFENGNGTVIKNNYIHGNYDNPIRSRNGSNSKILNNTITRSGRDGINSINVNAEVAWNDVSHSNLIADDCALFYYSGPSNAANAAANPKNIEIHHNWFHDTEGRGKLRKAAGIYLDTNPNSFSVHHNVVWNVEWTAIQMNWNALDINVYNNTFMKAKGGTMGAWHLAGTQFQRVNVWNNIADEGRLDDPNTQENEGTFEEQSDKKNNLISKVGFVDYTGNDFLLTASSPAVNAGIAIPGITDNAIGLPDVGAYELGVPAWKPGIDWTVAEGPANRCYNIPGNNCCTSPQTWYADIDNDGLGDPNTFIEACSKPSNYVSNSNDQCIGINDPQNSCVKEVPGIIQAEDYISHVGIQTETTDDTGGGQNIGYIEDGDSSTYKINVLKTDTYTIKARVASDTSGGKINVFSNNTNLGALTVVNTTGWQTWATVEINITLDSG